MPVLAEVIDAVAGVHTHRDTHALQMAHPNGVPIAERIISNDESGYVEAIQWALQHAPGSRLVFAMEGTRSYGIGLARALASAGLPVIEVVRSARDNRRRGRGKNDQIDAGLAVLSALRLDAARLPTPRADGEREALRSLLDARDELTNSRTRQVNRLRALLLTGDDHDRQLGRGPLTAARLLTISRRRSRADESTDRQVRLAEARRLAKAIRQSDTELNANTRQLTELVTRIVPTSWTGTRSARSVPRRRSSHSPTPAASATTAPSHP